MPNGIELQIEEFRGLQIRGPQRGFRGFEEIPRLRLAGPDEGLNGLRLRGEARPLYTLNEQRGEVYTGGLRIVGPTLPPPTQPYVGIINPDPPMRGLGMPRQSGMSGIVGDCG